MFIHVIMILSSLEQGREYSLPCCPRILESVVTDQLDDDLDNHRKQVRYCFSESLVPLNHRILVIHKEAPFLSSEWEDLNGLHTLHLVCMPKST